MKDRDGLLALAERVEKAEGPERGLDAEIVVALDIRPEWCAPVGGELWVDTKSCPDDPPIRLNSLGKRSPGNPPIGHYVAYTASLDAAMTLLDPTWFFHVSRFSPDGDGRGQAHVYPNRGLGDDYEGDAATPALALTAAALRARAATQE